MTAPQSLASAVGIAIEQAPGVTKGRTTPPPLPQAAPLTPPPRKRSVLKRALFGLGMIGLMAIGGAWLMHASIDQTQEDIALSGTARHELLGGVRSWGYQLQGLEIAKAAQSNHDLLVIDEDFEGRRRTSRRVDTMRALKALKRKPDGTRRLVLAYLSIGEAEDYRSYWDRKWVATTLAAPPKSARETDTAVLSTPAQAGPLIKNASTRPLTEPTASAPPWLGVESSDWRGNYHIRYWDDGWQSFILGSENAALDRIIAAGFDGVYLDRADAFLYWLNERPSARQDMTDLIERISERARTLSPGFIIVMQNAEELLGQHRIRKALDAVAKEDLLFGVDGPSKPNSGSDIASSVRLLKKAHASGLPVLVVEYLNESKAVAEARSKIDALGFIPYFAPRALDDLRFGP